VIPRTMRPASWRTPKRNFSCITPARRPAAALWCGPVIYHIEPLARPSLDRGELVGWLVDESVLQDLAADMSIPLLLVIVVASIVLLSKGADWMIDGVVDLAQRTGLPKIVIGATVVSLGTTLPEAFVSVVAAFLGGSFVSGTADEYSDLDLYLVIREDDYQGFLNNRQEFMRQLGTPVFAEDFSREL